MDNNTLTSSQNQQSVLVGDQVPGRSPAQTKNLLVGLSHAPAFSKQTKNILRLYNYVMDSAVESENYALDFQSHLEQYDRLQPGYLVRVPISDSPQDQAFSMLAQAAASKRLSSNVSNHHEEQESLNTRPVFPSLPPVVGVRVYKSNVEIVRAKGVYRGGGQRGSIKHISQEQYKRAVRVLTDSDCELHSLITVTYPETFPWDGRVFKAHLKRFLERMREEFGYFDYFLAIEYQKRGAPHAHIGLSLRLSEFGDLVTLKRDKGLRRRSETFSTVPSVNELAFQFWLSTIAWSNDGQIKYNGQSVDWSGLSETDYNQACKAFYSFNAGFSWEEMRDTNGATKYFVKELTGKKKAKDGWYQKSVPEGFENPGRHFLNSSGFVNKQNYEFALCGDEVNQVVELVELEHRPKEGRPLYKWLWNASAKIASSLLNFGYRPIGFLSVVPSAGPLRVSLSLLRQFYDLRLSGPGLLSGRADGALALARVYHSSRASLESKRLKYWRRRYWSFILEHEPMAF